MQEKIRYQHHICLIILIIKAHKHYFARTNPSGQKKLKKICASNSLATFYLQLLQVELFYRYALSVVYI